jgi:hypothetical protein
MKRDLMAPLVAADLGNDSYKISAQDFMTSFLKADDKFVEKCGRLFRLDKSSEAPLEWRLKVAKAIDLYNKAPTEKHQYPPFFRIIKLVLERAEQLASEFPRFKGSASEYTYQYQESPEGGTGCPRYPDIMLSATIDGLLQAISRWEQALFPLEFKKKYQPTADPLFREVVADGRIAQYVTVEETLEAVVNEQEEEVDMEMLLNQRT